jgi:hypothetical protein
MDEIATIITLESAPYHDRRMTFLSFTPIDGA